VFRAAVDAAQSTDPAAGPSPPVDAVFTSEEYGDELALRFGASHVRVDPGRLHRPVSGTAVRADPVGHWQWLAPPVRAWFARRVPVRDAALVGALTEHYRARGGIWAEADSPIEFHVDESALALDGLAEAVAACDALLARGWELRPPLTCRESSAS